MSSFNRRFILLSSMALLAGCGFTPVYGPSGNADVLQNAVLVDEPSDRPAFMLTQALEDRLGRASGAQYGLSYSIELSEDPIAVSASNVTTRYNVLGTVTFALRDLDSKAVLSSGKVDNFTSYSASGTTVATQAAQRDAYDRLMTILSDLIVTRLIIAAQDLPQ